MDKLDGAQLVGVVEDERDVRHLLLFDAICHFRGAFGHINVTGFHGVYWISYLCGHYRSLCGDGALNITVLDSRVTVRVDLVDEPCLDGLVDVCVFVGAACVEFGDACVCLLAL